MGKSVFRILSAHTSKLLAKQNVVGVGVGVKNSDFDPKSPPALVVLVKKKLPSDEIPKEHLVPKSIGGVLTDVVEVGEIQLLAQRTSRIRPAAPGVSIGHYKVTAGTLGALVKDKATGQLLILSNNHVLANITDGRDGRCELGDPIFQPGRYDGGSAQDIIARLERFVPIYRTYGSPDCPIAQGIERAVNSALSHLKPSYSIRLIKARQAANVVDAAVARPVSDDVVTPKILGVGRVNGIAEPYVGMKVMKSGRTTDITEGTIKVINATLKVTMADVGEAVFAQQIVTTAMAEGGDSGSLVVTPDLKAVGLLAAGSESATVMSHIQNVLGSLNVELV
ncbi:MAG TPA: hypothetical protein GXX40_03050 [Firmicutes bacterium]|nr:hypothetical protein [Bacillota bacterium]